MGKSISYCYKCSSLLREDDFARGRAFQDGNRVVCASCAPALRDSSTKVPAKPKGSTKITSTRLASVKKSIPPPEAEDSEMPPPPRRRLVVFGAAGAAALAAILLIVFLSKGRAPAPVPPPREVVFPAPVTPPPVEPPRKVEQTPDRELLEKGRMFAAEHPEDLEGQLAGFEKLVLGEFEKTPSAAEARKEIEAIKAKISEKAAAALAQLEEKIREPLAREEFAAVLRTLEEGGRKMAAPEWSFAFAKRAREISDLARTKVEELCRQAESLAAQGKAAEAQALVARVRGWEMPKLLERIEEAAGPASSVKAAEDPAKPSVPAEKKPRTEEGKAYLAAWREAMVRAAARDYDGALDDLRNAGAKLREPESLAEWKGDLEDVARVKELFRRTIDGTAASPPPWMSLELRDGRKAAGRVLRVDADRVQLASKAMIFAEWSEATAASIAALARKSKAEPRTLALFCLLEGDVEPAKSILGGTLDAAPAKYWAWAPEARAKIPKAEPIELAARDLFYAAEREYASMETRGLAVEKYRSLRKDYAASSLARKLAERIDHRTEACKEYYFAATDFERAGSLKRTKAGRLESDADSDANFANQNWAQTEFYALPGTGYRAWLHVGGCCLETFTFLWQGTELTAISPKTKKPISADVGAAAAPEVKPSIRGLKPTHDPKTPKAPARWEWIELPLPKYSAPGLKRLRFMTDQKGFAIGALVISSSRKAAPKEDEIKELEKSRAAEAPPVFTDPDLIACYLLDDGAGGTVADVAAGHQGAVVGTPKWIDGKQGGALDLDGQTHVEVKDAEDLRLTGDLTISFWMKKNAPAGDWQRMVGKGDDRLRNYGVWTGGGTDKILFQQFNANGEAVVNITSPKDVQIGKWHHVVATVRGTQATLYLDGAKEIEAARTGVPATSGDPLCLGWGIIHTKFLGALDDVRIYKRALTADEVRDFFEAVK